MNSVKLLVFCATLFVGAATPGPAIIAVVARVVGRGAKSVLPYVLGIIIGDLAWLTLAVAGLSILAHSFETAFAVIRYFGAAYLLYLAFRLWTAPANPSQPIETSYQDGFVRLLLGGLALELGNPKTMAFYLALLPNLIEVANVSIEIYGVLFACAVSIYAAVFGGYVLLASRTRQVFRSVKAMKLANRAAGTAMAGAAIAVAAR
jgi:threonine/homoserine/homoserine lactone efflux protein